MCNNNADLQDAPTQGWEPLECRDTQGNININTSEANYVREIT